MGLKILQFSEQGSHSCGEGAKPRWNKDKQVESKQHTASGRIEMLGESRTHLGHRNPEPNSNYSASHFLNLPGSANGPSHGTQLPNATRFNHRHILPHNHVFHSPLRPIPRPRLQKIHPPPKRHNRAPTNGRRDNLRRSVHDRRRNSGE